jgi:hypothetical protein
MAFANNCEGLIRKSNKDMINFKYDKGLVADYITEDGSIANSKRLAHGDISFIDTCFDIDNNDNVYGVVNNKEGHLLYIYPNDKSFDTSTILNYDHNKFNISYPYVKNINKDRHLIYYLSNKSGNSVSALFHHYNRDGEWFENKIDFINHIVLNNFVVTWNGDTPTIFYFNSLNGAEELFACRFNNATKVWSNPIQITNSQSPKIYLSIIKDSMNFYHITYSENVNLGYAVKYVSGYLKEDSFETTRSNFVTGASTCSFPSLTQVNSDLYLSWIQYNKLCTSISNDLGNTWSDRNIDEHSIEEEFIRFSFRSNCINDKDYNTDSVFGTKEPFGILGF